MLKISLNASAHNVRPSSQAELSILGEYGQEWDCDWPFYFIHSNSQLLRSHWLTMDEQSS